MIGASAPGKLVLTGEYAVLTGAPAVVLAVDRRAEVRIEPAGACSVRSLGHLVEPAGFDYFADGVTRWHEDRGAGHSLLDAVLQTLADGAPLPPGRAFSAVLDTAAFYHGPDKLGLGSSAALTVAATAALGRHFGRDFEAESAYAAHRRLQRGGSGLDIAAAIAGGLIVFVGGDAGAPIVCPVAWPVDLHAGFLWSGRPAVTAPRIRRFEAWSAGAEAGPLLSELKSAARSAADAWSEGDAQHILAATREYGRCLAELDEAAGVDIYGAGHAGLARLAEDAGVVYKPSGAGGGDLGVAFAADRRRLDAFLAEAARAGFATVGLAPEPQGLACAP